MSNRRAGDCPEEVADYMPGNDLPFALPTSFAAYMTGERFRLMALEWGEMGVSLLDLNLQSPILISRNGTAAEDETKVYS
ncbi:4477_t:CDS:2 [Paraglomus brasilianum]|uniref:4477_t:CDS:1 n=1 Tax=Paraglomus brasilianum TaxID=144538 RepID=A0A9N9DDI1_9GLOM|nr:4477_t:CDS:2 [Paraglomus brasilianum]